MNHLKTLAQIHPTDFVNNKFDALVLSSKMKRWLTTSLKAIEAVLQ